MPTYKTIPELPSVKPRESKYDIEQLRTKLSAINTPEHGIKIQDIHAEMILCLANEIHELKEIIKNK